MLKVACEVSRLLISIDVDRPSWIEKSYPWSLVNGQIWDRLCEIVESSTNLRRIVVYYHVGAPTNVPLEMLFDRLKHKQSSLELGVVEVELHDIFSHPQYQTMMLDVRYYLEHNPVAQLLIYVRMSTTV